MLGLKHFARVQTFRRKYVKILYCKFDQIWDMCTCIFGIFCLIFVVSDLMWKCCVLWLKIDLILDVCVHFWNPLPFLASENMWKCCVLWLKIDLIWDVCMHFWDPLPFCLRGLTIPNPHRVTRLLWAKLPPDSWSQIHQSHPPILQTTH